MPHYQLMIHGSEVRLFTHGLSRPIVGFYTTKRVLAADPRLAQEVAAAEVLQDWRPGGEFESGGIPKLEVEWMERVSLLHVLLKRKPRGYTFYSEDPSEEEAAELEDKDGPAYFVMD